VAKRKLDKLSKIKNYIIDFLYKRMRDDARFLELNYDSVVKLAQALKTLSAINQVSGQDEDKIINIIIEKLDKHIDLSDEIKSFIHTQNDDTEQDEESEKNEKS